MVSGTTDLPSDLIFNQEWDSLGFVFCQDCPEFTVSPHMTAVYRFRVTSETGCVIDDEVTIFVIEKGKYFIGNVFTPNGDNINDEIRLHTSPGIVRVHQWIIFDRWGDAVFGRTDFDPNDTSIFWDGRTPQGEELNPAVYPYMLEVELLNGAIEIYHGSITLLR
jgi:gliding motility-associated-like protein